MNDIPFPEMLVHERPRVSSVPPQAAEAQTRALSALNGLQLGDLTVTARPDPEDAAADWIILATARGLIHLAPVVVGGRPSPRSEAGEDHAAILAAASDLEPLFAALEAAGAPDLDLMGIATEPADDGVRLTLDATASDGSSIHTVRLIVAEAVALALVPSPTPSANLDLPIAVALQIDGPTLSPQDLGALQAGDFVILPRAGADGRAARAHATGAAAGLSGRLDLGLGLFTLHRKETPMVETPAARPPVDADTSDLVPAQHLPVAVTVSLGDVAVPLSQLTGLQPGATLAFPDLRDDLPVSLSSAGRAFARGRLVSLGQAYGVIIDSVSSET